MGGDLEKFQGGGGGEPEPAYPEEYALVLRAAIKAGNIEGNADALGEILSEHPSLLHFKNEFHASLYHMAATDDQPDVVRYLRKNHPSLSPNIAGHDCQYPPITLSAKHGDVGQETLEAFLEDERVDVEMFGTAAATPLVSVGALRRSGNTIRFKMLLDSGADPDFAPQYAVPGTPEGLYSAGFASPRRQVEGEPELEELLAEYDQIPRLPDATLASKAVLFMPNEHGKAILDHPLTWKHIGPVLSQLETQGDPLTLEDLCGKNADGNSWLEVAARSRCLGKTLDYLEGRGEKLTPPVLAENPLLVERVVATGNKDRVFDVEKWKGQSAGALRAVFNQMSPETQAEFPNRHAMLGVLSRSQPQGRNR